MSQDSADHSTHQLFTGKSSVAAALLVLLLKPGQTSGHTQTIILALCSKNARKHI